MARRRQLQKKDILSSPFKELAVGLSSRDEHVEDIWEEEPVGIQEFVEGEQFLNQKWNGRTGCRPKILEILIDLVKPHVREAMLLLGKGGGKDYLSAILHLFGIHRCLCLASPQSYYGLSANSKMYFVNTARNDTQAKKVFFEEFKGLLDGCPWFDGKYAEPGTSSVIFTKRIEAISVNSQAFGWLGFNTFQWVGDELAFFLTNDKDEESESRAEECWQAAFGSCKTRGVFSKHYKMIGITTPRFDDDFVMQKFRELQDREDGYTAQKATWDVHPNLTKEDFANELQKNYRRAMRDFGAQPMGVIESFWADPDFVENNVCEICRQCPVYQKREDSRDIYDCWDYNDCKANAYMGNGQWREWLKPDPDAEYFIHFDLSTKKDKVGFALSHKMGVIEVELDPLEIEKKKEKQENDIDEDDRFEEKLLIKVDAVGFISPVSQRDHNLIKNGEIYYSGILSHIVVGLIDRGFQIGTITTDQFQSHSFRQNIEDRGIDAELISLDRNDSLPVQAKIALVENRVEYPYSMILCQEARHLKYIKGKKVDHKSGKSKDVWDGFAGTIVDCENFGDDGKGWLSLESDDDD